MGGKVWLPPTLGVEESVPQPSHIRELVSKRSEISGLWLDSQDGSAGSAEQVAADPTLPLDSVHPWPPSIRLSP